MFTKVTTLTDFIIEEERRIPGTTGSLTLLLTHIENAAKHIASHIKKTGLIDIMGHAGTKNIYDEEVQKLDVYSNELIKETLMSSGQIAAFASEEEESLVESEKHKGEYIVYFDPLDGSSNIDVNVNIGTIFSIYKKNGNHLQKGNNQVAAGYILYGSSVMFVYSAGNGVNGFTLDPAIGSFLLSHPNIKTPEKGKIYSINEGYESMFEESTKKYLKSIKAGDKPYKLRYIGSLVADVHRTFIKGGIFLYPSDLKNKNGKLRLMFEVNPMSFLMSQSGGIAVSGSSNPLEIMPTDIHQRTPIVLGSKLEVENYLKYL